MANEIVVDKIVVGSTVQSGTNIGKDAVKTSTELFNSLTNDVSTGILTEYTVGINGDTTKIDCSGFEAIYSKNVYSTGIPVLPIQVTFPLTNGIIVNDIATENITYFGLLENLTVTQQNTPFTETQKKTIAQFAVAFHPASIVVAVTGLCTIVNNTASQLQGLLAEIGSENTSGNNFIKGTGNFNLTKSVGKTFAGGINTNNFLNPDRIDNALATDTQFYYSYRDGSGGYTVAPLTSDVDLTKYDNGSGSLVSITGKKASIQRCYYLPHLNISVLEYGQTEYKDFEQATDNLSADNGTHILNPALNSSQLRTYIIGATNASTLDDGGVLFRDVTGTVGGGSSNGDVVRNSISRLDQTVDLLASTTNVFNPEPAKFLKITMDANVTNLTYTNTPTKEGFDLVIVVIGDASVVRNFSLDASKFEGTALVGMPASTVAVDSINYIHCYYSLDKAKYIVVGKA